MICPHCHFPVSTTAPSVRAIEGGRAFAHVCTSCGHMLNVRPRTDEDPPVMPLYLSQLEIGRLRFVQWRLGDEARARLNSSQDHIPRTAA